MIYEPYTAEGKRKRMTYGFTDDQGSFELENAAADPYLYFPLCNEAGVMSCITPSLGGDIKLDQNHFIMQPVSVEDLHNNRSTRNFWLRFDDGELRSASGVSLRQKADRRPGDVFPKLRAGLLWHEIENEIVYNDVRIRSVITNFVPADATTAEIMRVSLENTGASGIGFDPIAMIPMYGRSAANIRDHRHVTSLLHRIYTERYGVRIRPTLSFDERGHIKDDTEYFTLGCSGEGNAPEAFYPTVAEVIADGGDFENPLGIVGSGNKKDGCGCGEVFEGLEATGGLRFGHRMLNPGEKAEYIIFIGAKRAGDTYNDAEEIISRFGNTGKLDAAFEANRKFWIEKSRSGLARNPEDYERRMTELAGKFEKQGILDTARLKNYFEWVGAEPVLRRIFGCSFLPYHDYGKGGRGWRDLWQDCLALMLGDPDGVKDLLVNNFAGVRADGTNATIIGTKPGEFIADRNGIARVWMDHGVWPWITVQLYMELSGDTDFLEIEQRYFKDMLCCRARDIDSVQDDISVNAADGNECCTGAEEMQKNVLRDKNGNIYRGSLLEHILLMHITAACDVGEHGHMHLRGADWNDALDMASQRGESVAFTMAYAGNLKEIAAFLSGKDGKYSILKELYMMIDELCEVSCEAVCGQEKNAAQDVPDHAKKRGILDRYCNLVRHNVSREKVEVPAHELSEKIGSIASSIMEHVRKTEYMTEVTGVTAVPGATGVTGVTGVTDVTDGELGWFNGYYDNEGKAVEDLKEGKLMLTGAVFAIMSGTADDAQIQAIIRTADKYLYREEIGGYRLNTRFENEEEYAHKLGRMFGFAYGSKENGAVFCHMAVMYAYALLKRGYEEAAGKVIGSLIKQSLEFDTSRIYPGIPEYFGIDGRGMYPYLTGAASWLLLYLYRL